MTTLLPLKICFQTLPPKVCSCGCPHYTPQVLFIKMTTLLPHTVFSCRWPQFYHSKSAVADYHTFYSQNLLLNAGGLFSLFPLWLFVWLWLCHGAVLLINQTGQTGLWLPATWLANQWTIPSSDNWPPDHRMPCHKAKYQNLIKGKTNILLGQNCLRSKLMAILTFQFRHKNCSASISCAAVGASHNTADTQPI